jgi:hypothetical protein
MARHHRGSGGWRETGNRSGLVAERGIRVVGEVHGSRAVLIDMEAGRLCGWRLLPAVRSSRQRKKPSTA